jgi:hypothetical protein
MHAPCAPKHYRCSDSESERFAEGNLVRARFVTAIRDKQYLSGRSCKAFDDVSVLSMSGNCNAAVFCLHALSTS